jgi:peptide-methionine (R)-S-oxide reductase
MILPFPGLSPAHAFLIAFEPASAPRLPPAQNGQGLSVENHPSWNGKPMEKINKSEAEWKEQLSPEAYYVTRRHGTERPFSHPYNAQKGRGIYHCIACGTALFSSDAKFDSGTGWPSFHSPMSKDAVSEHEDRSLLMRRIEVRCAACDAHLGHVFPDGPDPTGLRYCMNGTALKFDSIKE